jgi:hypothetical protein
MTSHVGPLASPSILADVAPQPDSSFTLGVVACAGISCLFAVSVVLLVVFLVRRNRKPQGGPPAGGAQPPSGA